MGIGATKGENGIYVQKLTADSKSHIAGEMFPMYGQALNIPADKNPKVQMKHMSAIVALKIVNQGDSKKENLEQEKNDSDKRQIVINDITFAVPAYSTSAISQKAIPIVGSFDVDPTNDINSASFTPVTGASSNSVKLEFASTKIDPGASATFYLAVRPFDVSNSVLGGSEKRTGLTLSITINGSTRSVEIPADTKFEAGKVTTLRVPVKLSYPKTSDAVEGTSFFSWSNMAETNLCVNGETLKAYVVGKTGELGTMTLTATGKEIINALDVGFYASTWKGQRSAMTVSNIDIWFDKDNPDTQISKYQPLVDIIKTELADDITKKEYGLWGDVVPNWDLINLAVPIVLGVLEDGIPRDDSGFLSFIYLTKFIDPQTITFNGVIESSGSSETGQIIILDEGPIYKEIKSKTVDDLLAARFSINNQTPKFEGILDIVNGNADSDNANLTASVLYNKLKDVIAGKGTLSMTLDLKITKVSVDINLENVFNAIITSVDDLKTKLPRMKFWITISTCPYHPTKESYGSKAKPIALEDIPGDNNPIIFWGLDMYGPDSSEPQM